jgi:hypothetical protein
MFLSKSQDCQLFGSVGRILFNLKVKFILIDYQYFKLKSEIWHTDLMSFAWHLTRVDQQTF